MAALLIQLLTAASTLQNQHTAQEIWTYVISGKETKKRGDRTDGHRVTDVPSFSKITAYLYPDRADNEVCLRKDLDITDVLRYLEEKNRGRSKNRITLFHCITAMMVRILNERRQLNRFVQGARIYERDEITVSFVAKQKFTEDAKETLIIYKAEGNHNIDSISDYITEKLTSYRRAAQQHNVMDSLERIASLPRPVFMLAVKIVQLMDFYGNVPKSLRNGDPAYTSVLLSNLGSIKCPSVYHHLNNYGTNSIMMTIGTMRKEEVRKDDGTTEIRDFVDISVTADERICDGFYFAKSIMLLDHFCSSPHILDLKFTEEYDA